jgi:hypothetical protein
MLAQAPSPAIAIALPQPVTEIAPEFEGKLSLNRIAAVLQVVLAIRRAARNEQHAYWYTVVRGM